MTNTLQKRESEDVDLRQRASLDRDFNPAELGERGVPSDDDGLDTAKQLLECALDKKALEPVLLDVRGLCSYANFLLILSGRSDRHVSSVADGIASDMRTITRPIGKEGTRSGKWALLDYGDVIVHVFHHPLREHYDLESLWNDAPRVEIEVPEEMRVSIEDTYV